MPLTVVRRHPSYGFTAETVEPVHGDVRAGSGRRTVPSGHRSYQLPAMGEESDR